jgi:hypothetical protein
MIMATISNSDGSCKTRVCFVDGKWVPYDEIITKTGERILGLLSDGPKSRRYFGKVIGGDAKFIDAALRGLARAGLAVADEGPVLNCRRGKVWKILG